MSLQVMPRTRAAAAGFTLIELMVAMVILGVLVGVAVPAYTSQTRKSRRTEARTALLDIAGREERYYSTNNKYSSTASDLGYSTFDPVGSGGYYKVTVTVPNASPTTYSVTATPVSGKGQDKDTQCASFSVDQLGNQTAKDSGANAADAACWG